MQPGPSRPLGPRSLQRSASPAPFGLPPVTSLNPRKGPRDPASPPENDSQESPYLSPVTPRPSLSLSLQIPGQPPKSGKKLPKLGLNIPSGGNAFVGGYYEGPIEATPDQPHPDSDLTVRPPQTPKPTTKSDGMENLRDALKEIEAGLAQTPPVPFETPVDDTEEPDTAVPVSAQPQHPPQFSDDVLEELARLGEGAGGAVHLVKDKRTGLLMARKTIATREAPMKQLLRELSIVSSTSHPNIIHFHGAYISPSSTEVKVLMEHCEGKSLEAVGQQLRTRGARLSEKVVGRMAEGILQGLAYLHSKRTIHRDIKPSNILLTRKGLVKLVDFGVSGELVDSHAGTFTGTKFYMAPERIAGDKYTIRSDVWSTGITLLELVENRYPFASDMGDIELMMCITQSAPPQLEGEWSDGLKDFIKQMLIVSATERPTPEDMIPHEWLVSILSGPKANMAAWMRQVWGWPEPAKKAKDSSA